LDLGGLGRLIPYCHGNVSPVTIKSKARTITSWGGVAPLMSLACW
jgi:hypothetical protein